MKPGTGVLSCCITFNEHRRRSATASSFSFEESRAMASTALAQDFTARIAAA